MSTPASALFFVGSYASEDDDGISIGALNESSGELRLLGGTSGVRNPSFLALHPQGTHLYSVSETGLGGDGSHGSVHSFRVDRDQGMVRLTALNHRSTAGDHPCHVRVGGHWLAVTNYGSGSVAVFPIDADGSIGSMVSSVQHEGSGPNRRRQEAPHPHSTIFTPDHRFLVVADLGIDRLVMYAFDEGILKLHSEVAARPGAGPRHLAFHPDGRHLFAVNELDSSVTLYRYDDGPGALVELQTLPTTAGATENTAADLHTSRSGGHLYVSNRGEDSVAVFAFDAGDGLTRIVVRPCGGNWPRGFGVAPGGGHLLVANRHSNDIAALPLSSTGVCAPIAKASIPQPTCVVFL